MAFVKLTSGYDGNPVFVNAANITTIESCPDCSGTIINLVGGSFVRVKESASSVVTLIWRAQSLLWETRSGGGPQE